MKKESTKKKGAPKNPEAIKKRTNIIAGSVVLSFALIGVITVISLIGSFTVSIFDNSEEKKKFETFITPVVMVDPVAFSSVSAADEHVLLMSSMWNLLMNVTDGAGYPEDEYGMMLIPSSDLDVSAASLFGSDAVLSHQTFGNTNINFEYDAENSSYIVPPMGYSVQYQPRVDKIKRKGKTYTLTVSYMTSNTAIGASAEDAEPDKVMYYVLEKTGKNKYVIKAILDNKDGDVSSQITSQATSSEKPVTSNSIAQPEVESSEIAVSE